MRAKVKMISNHLSYEEGQELTMSQENADQFVDAGVAEYMEMPEREVNPPPEEEELEEEETEEVTES